MPLLGLLSDLLYLNLYSCWPLLYTRVVLSEENVLLSNIIECTVIFTVGIAYLPCGKNQILTHLNPFAFLGWRSCSEDVRLLWIRDKEDFQPSTRSKSAYHSKCIHIHYHYRGKSLAVFTSFIFKQQSASSAGCTAQTHPLQPWCSHVIKCSCGDSMYLPLIDRK